MTLVPGGLVSLHRVVVFLRWWGCNLLYMSFSSREGWTLLVYCCIEPSIFLPNHAAAQDGWSSGSSGDGCADKRRFQRRHGRSGRGSRCRTAVIDNAAIAAAAADAGRSQMSALLETWQRAAVRINQLCSTHTILLSSELSANYMCAYNANLQFLYKWSAVTFPEVWNPGEKHCALWLVNSECYGSNDQSALFCFFFIWSLFFVAF